MRRFWKVAGVLALIAVIALATVAVVSADGSKGGRFGPVGDLWERMHGAIANALGITVEQYDTAIGTAREQVLQQAVDEGLLTEEQAQRMQDDFGPLARGGRAFGPGMMGFGMRGPGSSLVNVASEQLGMTVPELVDELEGGKSIADVAAEQGVELQDIADAWLADRAEFLAQAVADERMSQEEADEKLEHMEEEVFEHLQGTWPWEHDGEECEGHTEGFGGRQLDRRGLRSFGSRGSRSGRGR